MPTENGKQLQEYFNERTGIEKEMIKLKEEERGLVNKFDELNHELKRVMERNVSSPEEQIKKQQEIYSINRKIHEITEELLKVREKIEEKENEIDKVNEKINDMKNCN
jgi:chromosome segregation ATPase